MADTARKRIPSEALISLRCRLDVMPPRGADRGKPRKIPTREMEHYCEIVAAMKLRTANKKGRHLSTPRVIELLEEHGIETPEGLVRAPKGMLSRTTVNRYLREGGYDHVRMTRAPAAVRFEAKRSNDLWQFDLSPSDLKQVKQPLWLEPGRGNPTLMLYSIVDDRSGVTYQEYRCVYGEDVEAGLRFLFNAMAPKAEGSSLLEGIPEAIYMDNGPIARSGIFQSVMERLGVRVMRHLPKGKDGRRVTARSKGKVERPFRTVKEAHETLYHFHEPENEAEANLWLHRYLARYNAQPHRREPHSRDDDWLTNLPEGGVRQMCTWERFCAFAREPERRHVGGDARVTVDGVIYEVDTELAGETVLLWWGLFDQDLYIEFREKRFGPFAPSGGPIPLHRYRKPKKSKADERADRVAELAERLGLPRAAIEGHPELAVAASRVPQGPAPQRFVDPDPFQELTFTSAFNAKRAIADCLALPLAKLPLDERAWIDALLQETLDKKTVLLRVREHFQTTPQGKR